MDLKAEARASLAELISVAGIRPGQLVVVGGSTSEILGQHIGRASTLSVGREVMEGLCEAADAASVDLAVQCCEHLNRALVVTTALAERERLVPVSAYPIPGAGGALACAAMEQLGEACLVESLLADAGLDIGLTLIGMHLRPVAVPLRLQHKNVGQALVVAAKTRPRLVGGARAVYSRPDHLG